MILPWLWLRHFGAIHNSLLAQHMTLLGLILDNIKVGAPFYKLIRNKYQLLQFM